MGRIRLTGATSGYTELRAASTAGNNTITLPTTNGGEVVVSDSSGNVNIDSGTFYVDASNNRVGVGITSPTCPLGFASTTGQKIDLFSSTPGNEFGFGIESNELRICSGTASFIGFRTGGYSGSERARIDSSGRLLVGTSTSIGTNNLLQVLNTSGDNLGVGRFATTEAGPDFDFYKSRSGTVGINTVSQSGDVLGTITFRGADGSSYIAGARIQAYVDGTPGANDMPGRLVFSTTADGASIPTERMRIDSSGRLLVGTTTIPISTTTSYFADTRAFVNGDTFTDQCAAVMANGSASGSNNSGASTCYLARYSTAAALSPGAIFKGYQDTTIVIKINNNGNITNSNNSYGSLSDVKLKENIVDASSQWNDIKALQVRNYNFKKETGQETHRQIGLIAQEVEPISPGLVIEFPDANNEVTKTINYSVLYMKAVKALQEAMDRIESLEAKVAALESA